MSEAVKRRACAKVNLALAVDEPNSFGLHPIASWVAALDLWDEVELERASEGAGVSVERAWADDAPWKAPIDWPESEDLCARAVRALSEAVDRDLSARVRLTKRIPVGAGLGGGSSDAAATLLAAREAFGLDIGDDALRTVGRRVGADVPFFIDEGMDRDGAPRAALVEGTGERLERVAGVRDEGGGPVWLALVVPDFGCETKRVYGKFDDIGLNGGFRDADVRAMAREGVVRAEALFNDLEAAAEAEAFILGSVRSRAMQVGGAPAHVSGSGSALFVVCEGEEDARRRARAIEAELSGCVVLAVGVL